MTLIQQRDVPLLVRRHLDGKSGMFLHGNDDGAITAAALEIQRLWPAQDVSSVESSILKSEPGAFFDMLSSPALFGGRRLIVVEGAEDQHVDALQPVLDVLTVNAFLVVTGSLRKESRLRKAAEESVHCAVLALYEEAESAHLARVRREGKELGLTFAPGAAERLLELCSANRALIAAEMRKLPLLAPEKGVITVQAIEGICGDPTGSDVDALMQSFLEGSLTGIDAALTRLLESGESASLLPVLQNHLARLSVVRAAVESGATWEMAFRKPKPMIYFGQHEQVKKQLAGLTLEGLLRLQRQLQQITMQSRRLGTNGDIVAARALLMQTAQRATR
jgi:DNA polymerase-3 subunit delta